MSRYGKAYVPIILAPFTGESGNPETFFADRKRPLLDRFLAWMKQRRAEEDLRDLGPHLLRDIGRDADDSTTDPRRLSSSRFFSQW